MYPEKIFLPLRLCFMSSLWFFCAFALTLLWFVSFHLKIWNLFGDYPRKLELFHKYCSKARWSSRAIQNIWPTGTTTILECLCDFLVGKNTFLHSCCFPFSGMRVFAFAREKKNWNFYVSRLNTRAHLVDKMFCIVRKISCKNENVAKLDCIHLFRLSTNWNQFSLAVENEICNPKIK